LGQQGAHKALQKLNPGDVLVVTRRDRNSEQIADWFGTYAAAGLLPIVRHLDPT